MRKLLYISLIFILFASCSKDEAPVNNDIDKLGTLIELTEHEFASIAFDSPKELTEDKAIDILVNFIESKQQGSLTRTSSMPSISLIEKKVLRTDNERFTTRSSTTETDIVQTSIYEFKISDGENEGFALVSGDERSPALIAYVPKFDESTFSISGAQIMFEHAQASHLSDIVFIEKLKDSLRDKTYAKISEKLNTPVGNLTYELIKDKIQVAGEAVTRVGPVTNPPTRIYSFVYPLITTKWGQRSPYNSLLPDIVLDKNTGTVGKPYAGCVPVAIAQIFTYCEALVTYSRQGPNGDWMLLFPGAEDWKILKVTPKIEPTAPLATRNAVGNLMLSIYEGVNALYRYDSNGIHNATVVSTMDFVPYMQNVVFASTRQQYNWTVVQNSLTAVRPVLIWGSEHCWVLDGYAVCEKSGSTGVSQYDTYVTTNFGWNGSYDGYYKLNDDYSVDFNGKYNTTQLDIVYDCRRTKLTGQPAVVIPVLPPDPQPPYTKQPYPR